MLKDLKREEDGESGQHEDGQVSLPHGAVSSSSSSRSFAPVNVVNQFLAEPPHLLEKGCDTGLGRVGYLHASHGCV